MSDPILRRVLARIEESYVEPRRLDSGRMLASALSAAGSAGGAEIAPAISTEGGLVERLAPPLELVLVGAAVEARNALRAVLVGGVLGALDPYSRAVSGAGRQRLLERYAGIVGGIGVTLGRRDGRIRILACRPGSPSVEAGLRAGDVLTAVDGQPLDGRVVSEVVGLLRGRAGSAVSVSIERAPPGTVSLVRRAYASPSASGRLLDDGIGLVRVASLSKSTPAHVDRELELLGKAELAGLILDLRGNRGGSMLAAAAIADRFVGSGILLEALDRCGRPVPGLAHRVESSARARPAWPVVVLVDERTGSSAELLAAALVWNDRALLVGRRTFGKNLVSKLYHYDEADLTLKLAVAYLRTAGRPLPGGGLEPDVRVEQDEGLSAAAALLRGHGATSRGAWIRSLGSAAVTLD